MDRLRMGVIGLGWFGEIHCDAFTAIPHVDLAALCTRRPARLEEMGRKYGVSALYADYREMLANPDIDAVSVVTAWDQHAEPAIAALEAGKHVFLEKPMASTVEDCKRIVAAAEKSKGHLMVGHVVRFNPRHAAAKDEVDAGRIGKIVSLSGRRNIPAIWTAEMMNTVGPIMGNLIHDIDLALWYSGAKAVSVYAQTVSVRGLKYPDIAQVMLRLDSGATAMLESVACMAEGSPFDIDERMELIGDKGFIHVQETFPNIGIVTKDGFRSPDTTYWPSWRGAMRGALPEELAYFARCVLDDKAPDIITLEEALAATRVTLAAEESAASGKIVPL